MIVLKINSIDLSDNVNWRSLSIKQNLTSQVDTASFMIRKYGNKTYSPSVGDSVEIFDGGSKVFGGSVTSINESVETVDGIVYVINCVDHTFLFDSLLVSKVYENLTIKDIIVDLVANFTPSGSGFTTNNVSSDFFVTKIVFNQLPLSTCLRRLAGIVKYEWYIDEDKDVHFFSKFTNSAPFNISDDSGNYIYKSLKRVVDLTQLTNRCKVRGGEFDADLFTDIITVVGNDTKTFKLPYKFSNLNLRLDTGSGFVNQTVGIDFLTDPSTVDWLYNYNDQTIKRQTPLSDGDRIEFSGNPRVPVLAIAEDATSISNYGVKEKLIRDKSIEDITTARRRAIAEINTYKDVINEVRFKTYNSGLRAGQVINVNSVKRGLNEDFIIKSVGFRANDPNNFIYDVSLVTTRRWGLIEFLRKILEPEDVKADEKEVAEIIKTDIQNVSISELIQSVSATDVDDTLSISESIADNPLGVDTEPIWVLGYYVPSPWPTDTKRMGRLDYSLKVY